VAEQLVGRSVNFCYLNSDRNYLYMTELLLKKVFAEALLIPEGQVTDDLTYQSVKQWDSVAHMALVAAIEGTFNIMLDTDEVLGLSSVAKAREILTKHHITLS